LNIIIYITANILLFASWYVFLFRGKELLSFVDRIISTFILGLTQIIATEMLLGIVFRQLYATQLFWLNIFVSSVVLVYPLTTGRTIYCSSLFVSLSRPGDERMSGRQFLPRDIVTEISDGAAWLWRVLKGDLILFFIFFLVIVSVCWIIFLGYLFPSYTWDALWYHLPIVGYIMQNGAIGEIPNNSFIEQFINIFPKNIELFFIWNVIFLKNDVITDLSQLLFTIAGVLAIYSIAVKLKISKRGAIYSSLLFFFTPIVILQSTTNYVDVAVSMLFLMAVNFLIVDMPCRKGLDSRPCEGNAERASFQKRHIPTAMAGLTAGILLGSKGSGPLFAAILSAVVIIREFIVQYNAVALSRWMKISVTTFRFYVFYFFIPVLLMGGYWYIKNWIIYGNPVYPMEISFLNNTIFKGLYQGIVEPAPAIINELHPVTRPLYVWLEKVQYYLYDSRLGGLGPIWFILFLPSIVFSFVYALIRRHYWFIVLFMVVASTFLMYPRNWNPRYVIFIIGPGAISFGLVFDYFGERNNIFRIVALLLAGYTFLISNSPCVTPRQIKKFIHLPAVERIIAAQAPFNIDLQARQDYGYWTWINRNITQGETLAYAFDPLFLSPMWNSAFSSKVVYIKADDYKQWLNKLGEHNVTYILMRKNSEEDKWVERERKIFFAVGWMTARKEKFKIVYSDDNYKIAKFIASVAGG
jgi:hypothetical protein